MGTTMIARSFARRLNAPDLSEIGKKMPLKGKFFDLYAQPIPSEETS